MSTFQLKAQAAMERSWAKFASAMDSSVGVEWEDKTEYIQQKSTVEAVFNTGFMQGMGFALGDVLQQIQPKELTMPTKPHTTLLHQLTGIVCAGLVALLTIIGLIATCIVLKNL